MPLWNYAFDRKMDEDKNQRKLLNHLNMFRPNGEVDGNKGRGVNCNKKGNPKIGRKSVTLKKKLEERFNADNFNII